MSVISSNPVDGETLLRRAGTFWDLSDNKEEFQRLLEVLAWSDVERLSEVYQIRYRHFLSFACDHVYRVRYRGLFVVSDMEMGVRVGELPDGMDFAAEIDLPDGQKLEFGRDFLYDGVPGVVRVVNSSVKPANYLAVFHSTRWNTGDFSEFWQILLKLSSDGRSDAHKIRSFVDYSQGTPNDAQFRVLVGDLLGVRRPKKVQTVEDIRIINGVPWVFGSEESFHGLPGDQVLVGVGDAVQPGDDLFISLRHWDAVEERPPAWVSSLKVPGRYFSPHIQGVLEFSNAVQPLTVNPVNGKLEVTFPVTGDSSDVVRFFEFVRQREAELGYTLADFLAGEKDASVGQLPSSYSPLLLIWELWLRFGGSVTFTSVTPDLRLIRDLQMLRRAVPPWQTHILQFSDPVPDAILPLC
ncbi:MAG: hypothetical protein KatS3mg109_0014 [Pirellulaceae bacterium]|nr:MAG: hypothetical protein KatS3mg109_0014 [Pirellulaceae bacterium]